MNNNGPCKILISSFDAHGHVNPCLAIGAILSKRGNEVYFLNKSTYKESAEKQGLKFLAIEDYSENIDDDGGGKDSVEDPDEMYEVFKTPILERLSSWDEKNVEMMRIILLKIKESAAVLREIIPEFQFDILLGDFSFSDPFFYQCPIPFVPIMSCNPLALYNGPPSGVGLSVNDDPAKWQEYCDAQEKMDDGMIKVYGPWFKEAGLEVPTVQESHTYVKELGIYVFPEALDYTEFGSPKAKWVRMESAGRKSTVTEFQIPESLKDKPGKLIFFSLGSLASACLKLMNKLLESLSISPNRFIVSKGAFGDQLDLPNNMWGQNFVDQLAILPKVDLVITHGGNNTLVETLVAGKPMIVMPLFFDQLDNAQRIHDLNLGRRINPFTYAEDELLQTIEDLLIDTAIKEKVAVISKRIQNSDSGEKIAEYVEHLARTRTSPI